MNKNLFPFLLFFLTIFLNSCDSDDQINNISEVKDDQIELSNIQEFSSKESLSYHVKNQEKSLARSSSAFESAQDSALYDPLIEFLVPDEDFRNVLDKKLRVIVNDTLYMITKDGTFYTHKKNFKELASSINNVSDFKDISMKEKKLGNILLFDSHDIWHNNQPNPITDPNFFDDDDDQYIDDDPSNVDNDQSYTRSSSAHRELTNEDIANFPKMGLVKPNIIGKFLEFAFNKTTYDTYRFKSNRKRKLYVSFYNKDFVAYRTIGFDVKVMKKLWHGMKWGHMKNWPAGVYSGFSKIRIEHKINPPKMENLTSFFDEIKRLQNEEFQKRFYSDFYYAIDQNKGLYYNSYPLTNDLGKGGISVPILINLLGNKNISSINKEIEKGLKSGIKYLEKEYYSTNKKTGAYTTFDESNKYVYYTTYINMLYFNGGGYRVRDTFLKERKNIEIPFTLKGGDIKPGMPKFGSGEVISSKVIAADGIVYTEDGDDWIGVSICFGDQNQ